ncbi:septal ring lytic transglycosylase RlpA family protein [Rickettsiales bacterium]|nr:septal ring lytic transglycosylase RlpA family protein [Rickettsiales bacterium]
MNKFSDFGSFGRMSSDTSIIAPDSYHGYYKIGEPYEIDGQLYVPKEDPNYEEVGIASWYGPNFNGKKTANGDTFDQNALTAAHRTLPIPSMVRVTNLENNKTIILMVNDRGPFSKGRILDVSKRGAEILGFKDKGIARVKVQFLKGHTRRLLADLPADKMSKPVRRSFPLADDEEEESSEPFDLASMNKNSPIKELSELLGGASPNNAGVPSIVPDVEVEYKAAAEDMQENLPLNDSPEQAVNEEYEAEEEIVEEKIISGQGKELASAANEGKKLMDAEIPEVENEIVPDDEKTAMQEMENEHIEEIDPGSFYIQAGTYGVEDNAFRAKTALSPVGRVVISQVRAGDRKLHRVRVGPIKSELIANVALNRVIKMGYPDAMLVQE